MKNCIFIHLFQLPSARCWKGLAHSIEILYKRTKTLHMKTYANSIIESIGVYLPPRTYSTDEVLSDCEKPLRFPLEKITGIRSRHIAGEDEFSIDLAQKAIVNCFDHSKYTPADIDILVCCNISRVDAPFSLTFEPCTAIRLKKHFGLEHALVFDISNACAGMFTGMYIVDALLKTGAVRRGMVVSGEYITHLTSTAQKEIEGFMDSRLACLTLGDAGAAVILEQSTDERLGFQSFDMQTLGTYSSFCIAKEAETEGWVMFTDAVNMTDAAIKSGGKYALDVIRKTGSSPDSFQHLIMHQTSRMSLDSARREINLLLKSDCFHAGNTIVNLEHRGNTASTSHIVALADHIHNQRIQAGDRVVFSISASGLTVGAALYTLDDLPERLRRNDAPTKKLPATPPRQLNVSPSFTGIRIESIGTLPETKASSRNTLELLHMAAADCLDKSSYSSNDIGVLIHTGVYRSEYVMEPALAALLAGKLNMNGLLSDTDNRKTLAFDVFNGSIGFLNACHIAQQMIESGKCKAAMIVASEIENNAKQYPDCLMGLRQTASAIILDAHPASHKGLSRFLFRDDTSFLNSYTARSLSQEGGHFLAVEKAADLEDRYLDGIAPAVDELLRREGIAPDQVNLVFPPQISTNFISRLIGRLELPRARFVDVAGDGPDLFSSSLPYGLAFALRENLVQSGDIGLMIAAGSGIQIACAIYKF